MSNVCVGKYPRKSAVSLLIVELDLLNLVCIYSRINFIIDQAKRLDIERLVLAFYQPLWLKATESINAKSIKNVLILDGFHLMISFLGTIGTLIKGSGVSEALHTVRKRLFKKKAF